MRPVAATEIVGVANKLEGKGLNEDLGGKVAREDVGGKVAREDIGGKVARQDIGGKVAREDIGKKSHVAAEQTVQREKTPKSSTKSSTPDKKRKRTNSDDSTKKSATKTKKKIKKSSMPEVAGAGDTTAQSPSAVDTKHVSKDVNKSAKAPVLSNFPEKASKPCNMDSVFDMLLGGKKKKKKTKTNKKSVP